MCIRDDTLSAHIVPSWYRTLIENPGRDVAAWSLESHLTYMFETGITLSVVSASTPAATHFTGDAAQNAALARLLNEFMSALADTYPGHFAFVAAVPLPYVGEAVREAEFALDKLGASGIGMLSSHGGVYHGAPSFKPFYSFLNSYSHTPSGSNTTRTTKSNKLGLFYHPTVLLQTIDNQLRPAYPEYGFEFAPFDFLFDTARNIMNMTAAGTMRENENLNFGFAHCGGAFASVADRYFSAPGYADGEGWEVHEETFHERYEVVCCPFVGKTWAPELTGWLIGRFGIQQVPYSRVLCKAFSRSEFLRIIWFMAR